MKVIYLLLIFFSISHGLVFGQGPGLTAVFNSRQNNVSIKWQHTDNRVSSYTLQRSSDNVSWTDIISITATSLQKNKIAKYTDSQTVAGKGYYRLKIHISQAVSLSNSIMVIIGDPGNNWLMYPVPVNTVLNLQYNGSDLIPGVITVIIRTIKGQVLKNLRLSSTTRFIQIPVDNLGRGTYDIQIIIGNEVVWNQRFIK
ncbi:MAG: hypothetical protein WKF35_00390 [Ferruginibacter sp.]